MAGLRIAGDVVGPRSMAGVTVPMEGAWKVRNLLWVSYTLYSGLR